ncbi:MAG TPA: protein kinase [Thermoanaerobaculia bacterium]|nr:protein kinase [Thermoanaerobaculia bacterium]
MPFVCIHCRSEIDPKFRACPFCGEPITEFLRRHLDAPVDGKYQILSRLGVGGMGEVYKALHVHLNALRVLKIMRPSIATDPGAHERFLREARMATRIHHPSVAALYDFSTFEDGSRYMVWEYIEGTNLHEMLDERGPLSPRYAAELAIQALSGLEAIHRAGIVHRDISPENLMITRDDEGHERVKIIDLGIAKQWSNESDEKTKTGMFVGKWKYCSPEHLGMLEAGGRIDARADLYSFGIVLYEMLTGAPPFQSDTPHGYLMLHASETPKALRETNPTVAASPQLEAVIFRALEKDRDRRFASAREFSRAIEEVLPSLSTEPGATPKAVAVEVTEEPTRSPRNEQETLAMSRGGLPAAVSISDSQLAETIETGESVRPKASAFEKVLSKPPVIDAPAPTPRNWKRLAALLIGGAILIAAAFVAIRVIGNREGTQPLPSPSPIPIATAHLGLNAFPWGEVTSIRNTDSGQHIEMKTPLVTPAPIDLAPGRYEITMRNPAFPRPVIQSIEVRAGDDRTITLTFTDPSQAALPRFDEGTR